MIERFKEKFKALKGKPPMEIIKLILSSSVLPFFTCAIVLASYYLGWDLLAIFYVGLVGALMILVLDDLTPLVTLLPFLHVVVSLKNSPTNAQTDGIENASFYSHPAVLALIGIVIVVFVAAIVVRMVFFARKKIFKPNGIFIGLCIFAAALMANGFFASGYTVNNLLYGTVLAFFFLVVYVLIFTNVKPEEQNYLKLGWGFLAFSILLVVELGIKYVSIGSGLSGKSSEDIKQMMVFGWGVWNTIGMLIVICIPPVMLLSTKYKHGWAFIIYGTVLAMCAVLTFSRQAMLFGALTYVVSVIFAVVKSKNRIVSISVVAAIVCVGAILVGVKWSAIMAKLGSVTDNLFGEDGGFTGNGRTGLIERALMFFVNAPVFGKGFHAPFDDGANFVGLGDFVPMMAHNTYAELLAVSGFVGFSAYVFHRVQTIIEFTRTKITINKIFFAITLSSLLLMSLIDNHIFYIFPTIIYSSLLPFALGSEDKSEPKIKKEEPEETDS